LLGTSTTAPYSFTWTNVAVGSYSITAKATDNQSAATTSTAASITVSAPVVAATKLYYVHPDHLGTPRLIANQAGATVWRWDNQEGFGLTGLQEDPDADTKKFVFNLRFAGQYYDQESGLHYNRFRDYDPVTGRYVQGDPVGLAAGVSLYSYVSANPLSFIDPLGLARCGVDFSKSDDLYPVKDGQKNIVEIEYTGSRRQDYAAANKAGNIGNTQKPPKDYTWHHLDDYNPETNRGTMQLVKTDAHEATYPHDGGVRQYTQATGKKYK
jgi:RHS repeat-associated protein